MDNKKWYKKYATIFWFSFAILPLIISLINSITNTLVHWSEITNETTITTYLDNNKFTNTFISVINWFGSFTPTLLKNSFRDLFINFDISSTYSTLLGIFFGWFTFTYFIHVIVDIMIWLPKMLHSWIDRWC